MRRKRGSGGTPGAIAAGSIPCRSIVCGERLREAITIAAEYHPASHDKAMLGTLAEMTVWEKFIAGYIGTGSDNASGKRGRRRTRQDQISLEIPGETADF
jgi:hypothetical protein